MSLENFAQVEPFVGRFVSRETFEAVRGWQLGVLERDAGRFRARVEQGRIRDGHGDLRLEHVYFEDSDPIVIDCVEFNERLRHGDTAADVAFLAMELTVRARRDLAELFLAGFALESDDYDLYGVVDFYVGYRAWVRGKIAAFLAADPSTPPEKAARKDKEARTLFALARSYAETRFGGSTGDRGRRRDRQRQKHAGAGARAGRGAFPSSRRTGSGRGWQGSARPSGRRTASTARRSRPGRSTSCSDAPRWWWAPGAASSWTRRSARGTCGSARGTWPGATGASSSLSRPCATKRRSASAFAAGLLARRSPTPGNRCSSESARSSSR